MGIKNLKQLIDRHAREAMFTMPLSALKGKRVAIDGNNWVHVNLAVSRKHYISKINVLTEDFNTTKVRQECLQHLIMFLLRWIDEGVLPVIIFDGKAPLDKNETIQKRREANKASKARVEELYERTREDKVLTQELVDDLQKGLRNYNSVSFEDIDIIKLTLKQIGFPVLQSNTEGEKLCSALCREGKVAAVLSTDTDNLVFGAPLLITGMVNTYDNSGQRVSHLNCIRLDTVLKGLQCNQAMFIDLCIMCGCDYNTNLPGYGAIKSYALIKKYQYLENMIDHFDLTCLKWKQCRGLFTAVPSYQMIVDNPIPVLELTSNNLVTLREYLQAENLESLIDRISYAMSAPLDISDGHPEELQLLVPPPYSPGVKLVVSK